MLYHINPNLNSSKYPKQVAFSANKCLGRLFTFNMSTVQWNWNYLDGMFSERNCKEMTGDKTIMNEWTLNLKKTICKLHCKAKTIKADKAADLAELAVRNFWNILKGKWNGKISDGTKNSSETKSLDCSLITMFHKHFEQSKIVKKKIEIYSICSFFIVFFSCKVFVKRNYHNAKTNLSVKLFDFFWLFIHSLIVRCQ